MRARLERTDVVTPALAGFDAPLPPGFTASKEAYVDWLIEQIERVGEPVDLVGRLVMFPESGHWWPATKPAEVATALETLWSG